MAITRTFKRGLTAVAAGALAISMAGCASGDNGGTGDEGGENVWVDVIGTNPPHLNPQLVQDAAVSGPTAGTIYESLIRVDAEFAVQPWLAESWDISEDGTEYTLNLVEGVTWHDGEPFTSADVKFNIDEIFQLSTNTKPLTDRIVEVTTPDEETVVIQLSEAFGPFLAGLATQEILPAHLYEGTEIVTNPANTEPVGTGPFLFDKFIAGDRVEVVKNDDYWGEAGDLDRIVFKIMPDSNARVLALQSGEVDRLSATYVDPAQLPTLRQDDNLMFTGAAQSPNNIMLFFNTRNAPLDQAEVRQALFSAIDRESIAENAYGGIAVPTTGIIPEQVAWAYSDEVDFTEIFEFDADAAASKLDEAGLTADSNGVRFNIDLSMPAGFPAIAASAEIIKSNLEEIGVQVNLVSEELQIFIANTYTNSTFGMAMMTGGIYEDPSLGVPRQYQCNPNNTTFVNPSGLCDEELMGYFGEAAVATSLDERRDFFSQASARVAETAHALPLVWEQPESALRQDKWDGLEEFAGYTVIDWTAISAK